MFSSADDSPANAFRKKHAGLRSIDDCISLEICPIFLLSFAIATTGTLLAQTDQSAKQDMKDAGNATKSAAKDTGKATKKTAKQTGHAAKKATNKTARKTKEGSQKVEDKTQPK